ncbi:MAG TPA: CRISPR-associated endonuclease Cas1 [Actinomycetaceae bacterium]|nr:CRISPR-associated endonuclease Cas1 [Actinomycetaceae bacterium]
MSRLGAPSREQLERAWRDVLANDASDGSLAPSVKRFSETAEERLDVLADQLASGTWQPNDLTLVEIAVGDKNRTIHVPSARDRVVERALLDMTTPVVDPWLGPASYGYRPGLGVADAVQAVVRLRDEGMPYALRTDVDNCFPSIRKKLALRMFECLVDNDEVTALVRALFSRQSRAPGRFGRLDVPGLPLGCALSPMLTNLVLTRLDEPLLEEGFAPVRYADDLAVATETLADAWEAARVASAALEEIGMQLGPDKTEVMSFEEGFCFLGEDFGARYPPTVHDHRVEVPAKKTVFVAAQGGRVRIQRGRLIVESSEDTPLVDIPTGHVARVTCFGAVGFSAGARNWALGQGVDTVFASRRGNYLGSLTSAQDKSRVGRLRAQIHATGDPERRLAVARTFAEAKLVKQAILLRRFGRRSTAEIISPASRAIARLADMLPDCTTVDEVRGLEGAAAGQYFPAFGALFPEGLDFQTRSRRPPMDTTNAALSYLYTILLGECETALRSAGLDPAIGFLHADEDGRPSLALDLMEGFRPLIVDQATLNAARRNQFTAEHGRVEKDRPGVLLTKAGREAIVGAYETRMLQSTRGALPDFAGSLRRHLYRQAQRLVPVLHDPTARWTGLSWR